MTSAVVSNLHAEEGPPLSPRVEVWKQDVEGRWAKTPDQRLDAYCSTALSDGGVQLAFVQSAPPHGISLSASDQERLQLLLGFRKNFWSAPDRASSGRFDIRRWHNQAGDDIFTLTSEFLINEAVYRPHLVNETVRRPQPIKQLTDKDRPLIERRWNSLGLITRWSSDGSFLTMLPTVAPVVQEAIIELLQERGEAVSRNDPFAVIAIIFEAIVSAYNVAVWSWRDHVRYFETRRLTLDLDPESKYVVMHELARNAMNCSETVASGKRVLESVIEEHSIWCNDHGPAASTDKTAFCQSQDVARLLRGHQALLNGISLRSTCLQERLKNEISLAFTAVNQQQSMASVLIAEAAQSDSASTRMISILGLMFFPLTVVSSIFSTTFFTNATVNDESGATKQVWQMSDRFWIYWVFALPLTAITFAGWICYYRYILQPSFSFDSGRVVMGSRPLPGTVKADQSGRALPSPTWPSFRTKLRPSRTLRADGNEHKC